MHCCWTPRTKQTHHSLVCVTVVCTERRLTNYLTLRCSVWYKSSYRLHGRQRFVFMFWIRSWTSYGRRFSIDLLRQICHLFSVCLSVCLSVSLWCICVFVCDRKHPFTHTHTHRHARTHALTLTHTHTHIHTHARTHARTHTRTHARTQTHTHTHTYTHKYPEKLKVPDFNSSIHCSKSPVV